MFGQDIFTLRSSLFEGRPPKSVNMYWRRFKIEDIPYNNEKAFDVWLRNRWREKDHLLEYFSKNNRFPAEKPWERLLAKPGQSSSSGKITPQNGSKEPKNAKFIETEVKSKGMEEFMSMFVPVTALGIVLYLFYGASTDRLPNFPDLSALGSPEGFAKILESIPGHDVPVADDVKKMIMNSAAYLGGQQMEVKRSDEDIEREVEQLAQTIAKKQVKPRPVLKKEESSSSSSSNVNLKALNLTSATGKPITLANGVVIHPKGPIKSTETRKDTATPVRLANGLIIKQPNIQEQAKGKPVTLANGLTIKPQAPKGVGPTKLANQTKPKPKVAGKPIQKPILQGKAGPAVKRPIPRPPLSVSSTIANDRAMSSLSVPSTATISTTARRAPPSVASDTHVPRKINQGTGPPKLVGKGQGVGAR